VKIAAHMLDGSRAEGLKLGFGSPVPFVALVSAMISLALPLAAWGDVYKWTDEKGMTFFSDVLPKPGEKVKNFEVVAKARPETKASAKTDTPAEQALLARVDMLERQLHARQPAAPPPALAPPPTGYYPPAPPPTAPIYYDSGYDSSYYPSFIPAYYPSYATAYYPRYAYPVVRPYSYAAYPARAYMSRPVFAAPRVGSFHAGAGHGGGGRGVRR
jgi:hypothetical protein